MKHCILKISITPGKGSISGKYESAIKLLLRNLLLYASSFTYSYKPEELVPKERNNVLELFSIINCNGVKQLLIYSSLGGVKQYVDTLNYLAKVNIHSILSSDILMVVKKPMREAYDPRYISWAHISLKKNIPIATYRQIPACSKECTVNVDSSLYNCSRLRDYVNTLVKHLVPLVLIALHSGIHRYKQAINQVVFQMLTHYIYLLSNVRSRGGDGRVLDRLYRYAIVFQSAIVADTYVWIPYIWNVKTGAYSTEFLYSVASQPLTGIVNYFSRYGLSGNVMSKFSEVQNEYERKALKSLGEVGNLNNLIIKVKELVNNTVCNVFKCEEFRGETLIGGLSRLLNNLKFRGKYGSVVLVATEQTSTLLLKLLSELVGAGKIHILYTPQTLYQILLLVSLNNSLIGNVELEYTPIPSSEPYVCESIMENLLLKVNRDDTLFLLQGASSTILPLYVKLLELGIREDNILFM